VLGQSIKIKNYDNEPNRTKKSFPLVGRPVQSRAKIGTRGLYDTLKNVCHSVGSLPRLARQAAVGEAFKNRKTLKINGLRRRAPPRGVSP